MRERQTCVDCGKLSPETETNYTLISSQFGWRLSRSKKDDGTFDVEWRCPDCWREHKRAKGETEETPPPRVLPTRPAARPPGRAPMPTAPLPSFASSRPPPAPSRLVIQSPPSAPRVPSVPRLRGSDPPPPPAGTRKPTPR